jgi:hypothetical protein
MIAPRQWFGMASLHWKGVQVVASERPLNGVASNPAAIWDRSPRGISTDTADRIANPHISVSTGRDRNSTPGTMFGDR